MTTLLKEEVTGWSKSLPQVLLRAAAKSLGESHRERFEEEWLNELEHFPGGPVTKTAWALHIWVGRKRTAKEFAAPDIDEPTIRIVDGKRVYYLQWRNGSYHVVTQRFERLLTGRRRPGTPLEQRWREAGRARYRHSLVAHMLAAAHDRLDRSAIPTEVDVTFPSGGQRMWTFYLDDLRRPPGEHRKSLH
ncbi:hypothetical protein [Nocardia africana]